MFITFQEKNKRYEVNNSDTDKIFEDEKANILKELEKYRKDDCDLFTAVFAYSAIIEDMKQLLSNSFGADKIIETLNAKEDEKEENSNANKPN